MSIKAMKQALEALEYTTNLSRFLLNDEANIGPMLKADEAITSLRQAIAEVEPQKSPWAEYWKGLLAENEALRHRLAEAEKQESVVRYFEQWQASPLEEVDEERFNKLPESVRFKLYEAPQPAQKPLTDVLLHLFQEWKEDHLSQSNYIDAVEQIKATHGIKE